MGCTKTLVSALIFMVVVNEVSSYYYRKKEKKEETCDAVSDVVFLFDESGSIPDDDPGNYQDMIEFMMNVVSGFSPVGPDGTQFGAVCFNQTARTHFFLNENSNAMEVNTAISDFQSTLNQNVLARTAIGDGLQLIKDEHFLPVNGGGRDCAVKIVIVLTDGNNNEGAEPGPIATDMIQNEGITIFAVGIGSDVNQATMDALTLNQAANQFRVEKFSELNSIIQSLVDMLCEQAECTSTGPTDDGSGKKYGYGHGKGKIIVPVPIPVSIPIPNGNDYGNLRDLVKLAKKYGSSSSSSSSSYKPNKYVSNPYQYHPVYKHFRHGK